MPRLPLLLLAVALTALAACDSGSAVNPPSPADVAGTYDVTSFRFRPDASGIATVNLLDTLAAGSTQFEILDSGDAFLRYRFAGGTARLLLGEVEVRQSQIRLTFESGTETNRLRLLLPSVLVLDRTATGIQSSTATTANLEAFNPNRYAGLNNVEGSLMLTLTAQTTSVDS